MMITVIGLLIILFAMVAWIVFRPIRFQVDTDLNRYEITQQGIFSVSLHPGEKPLYTIRVLGFKIPSSTHVIRNTSASKRTKPRAVLKRSFQTWLFLIKGLFNSFRLKKLTLNMDVEDIVLNAQLVPLLLFLNRGPVSIHTNIAGRYYFNLEVEGRLDKMLMAFIRFLIKK